MRLTPTVVVCSFALITLPGCGTKTPLTLPPPAPAPQKSSLLLPISQPTVLADSGRETRP